MGKTRMQRKLQTNFLFFIFSGQIGPLEAVRFYSCRYANMALKMIAYSEIRRTTND